MTTDTKTRPEPARTSPPRGARAVFDLSVPNPRIRLRGVRTDHELPLSHCRVVTVERSGRQTLELFAPDGELLDVASDSPLDPTLLRSAWRGTEPSGRAWAMAVGHVGLSPVHVSFTQRRGGSPCAHVEVRNATHGSFWITEIVTGARYVRACCGERVAAQQRLQPLGDPRA